MGEGVAKTEVDFEMGKCAAKTEVYSRVCGFYRPVDCWNKGKAEEYKERTPFKKS